MALETLKDVKEIGGFKVLHRGTEKSMKESSKLTAEQMYKIMGERYVWIDHGDGENWLHFKIQDGPIKEVGVNGCQIDTIIHAAKKILEGLDAKFPSEYNKLAINKLNMALSHLQQRTKDREARGVEGTSNA